MASTAWYNGVDPLKSSDEWYWKSIEIPGVSLQIKTFYFTYTYWTTFQDFNCVHGFEKLSAWVHAAKKKHFCTRMQVPAHAHMKTGFDGAER